MNNPALSLITISYRDPDGLRQTLSSLGPLASSGLEWEHVLVDSSPEQNNPIIEDLSSTWPLRRFVQDPRGIYAAFNLGIEKARGDVVWFLNSGDLLRDLSVVQDGVRSIRETQVDYFCAGAMLAKGGREQFASSPRKIMLWNLLGRNWICHQSVLYKKSFFEGVGRFTEDYPNTGDYEHHIRCYLRKPRARFDRRLMVTYDLSGGSTEFKSVFCEFKKIHRKFAGALPLWVVLTNEVWRQVEYRRIQCFKWVSGGPLGNLLRPVWVGINRAWGALR